MRRIALFLLAFGFLMVSTQALAQTSVPNLSDRNWTSTPAVASPLHITITDKAILQILFTTKTYTNSSSNLQAIVLIAPSGEELYMLFSDSGPDSDNPKAAIKVNGNWYLSRNSGPSTMSLNMSPVFVGSGLVGVKLSVDTVDGLKEVVVNLR